MSHVANGVITVDHIVYDKKGGEEKVLEEGQVAEKIEVQSFAHNNLAEASTNLGMTVNLGNFQSARIDIGVRLPCYIEQVQEALDVCYSMVNSRLESKVAEIVAAKEARKKL